jgi:hypothetical protein
MATGQRWSVREIARQIDGALFERAVLNPPKVSTALREVHPAAEAIFRDAYFVSFSTCPTVTMKPTSTPRYYRTCGASWPSLAATSASSEARYHSRSAAIAGQLPWGSAFSDDAYCYSAAHYVTSLYGRTFHWWNLPEEMELATTDPRDWREILDQISDDIGTPHEELYKAKQSINGVIANANSNAVRSGKYTVGTVISMSVQRFRDRPQYVNLVQHPQFETLVFRRALELTSRKR